MSHSPPTPPFPHLPRSGEQLAPPTDAYRPCVPLLVAISAGILADRSVSVGWFEWSGMALSLLAAWHLLARRGFRRLASLSVCLAVASATAGWAHHRWHLFDRDELGLALDESSRPVTVEAIVRRGPRITVAPPPQPLAGIPRGDESRLVLSIEQLRDGRRWRHAAGLATLTVDGHVVGIHAGDRIRVHGTGWCSGQPVNPGQPDYASLARAQRELCRIRAPHPDSLTLLVPSSPWHPRRIIDEMRRRGQAWLQRHVPPQQADLAIAVLLGAREGLDEQRSDAFFQSGLAHLLAVSGLNVAIFAYGFWLIARVGLIPRRPAIVMVAGLALLYALVTDAEPPVLRAALLVVASAASRLVGRHVAGENTLASAACLVLLFDPSSLFHAGAQLSFLAVAVLDRMQRPGVDPAEVDPLDRLLARSEPWPLRWLRRLGRTTRESVVTSGLVWLVTLPLVVYRFHVVSPIALILNPLVMLPMTLAMYAGAVSLVLAGIWPAWGDAFGAICGVCLTLIEGTIAVGLRVPGNHFWLPAPSAAWVVTFYSAAAAWTIWPEWRPPRRWSVALGMLWVGWGCTALLPADFAVGARTPESGRTTRVTFVAVGHGTAVLVEFSDGRTLLYDGGRLGNPTQGSRAIAGVLWYRHITHLDAIVISHADTDHYNAIPELSERFSIGVVYVSPVMFREPSPALVALRESLRRARVPIRELVAGDRFGSTGPAQVEVWHPPQDSGPGSDNSHSVVLSIEHGGRRLLLPGDLESPGLDQLLASPPRPCDIVMAPHHGRVKSNPRGFAAWATPRVVVVSGSRQRDDPELRRAYTAAGCHLLHTGQDGAVEVTFDAQGVRCRTWRRDSF